MGLCITQDYHTASHLYSHHLTATLRSYANTARRGRSPEYPHPPTLNYVSDSGLPSSHSSMACPSYNILPFETIAVHDTSDIVVRPR